MTNTRERMVVDGSDVRGKSHSFITTWKESVCGSELCSTLHISMGVFYKFKSASSTGVAQPLKCNLFTNRKIAKVYKSMIKVQGFAACFSELF